MCRPQARRAGGRGLRPVPALFGKALLQPAKKDERIVGRSADRSDHADLHVFAEAMPDRFHRMGMAEQVRMSAVARLARDGFIPFAASGAVLSSRRAYDFIAKAIAEENITVKIVCAQPGLTTGHGPSQQAKEDPAISRGLTSTAVNAPRDADDAAGMVPEIATHAGPVRARLLRGKVPSVLTRHKPDFRFRLGSAQRIDERRDVLVISSGFMTTRALEAAGKFAQEDVNVAGLQVPTFEPLDTATILAEAAVGGRLVVTARDHGVGGGLGEAVAETFLRAGGAAPELLGSGPDDLPSTSRHPRRRHLRAALRPEAAAQAGRQAARLGLAFLGRLRDPIGEPRGDAAVEVARRADEAVGRNVDRREAGREGHELPASSSGGRRLTLSIGRACRSCSTGSGEIARSSSRKPWLQGGSTGSYMMQATVRPDHPPRPQRRSQSIASVSKAVKSGVASTRMFHSGFRGRNPGIPGL